jgi:predicted O-linked N-acetylglucosamine transferase (SPINDLY family)
MDEQIIQIKKIKKLIKQKRLTEALIACKKLRNSGCIDIEVYFLEGVILNKLKKYKGAIKCYSNVLHINSDHALAHLNMGISFMALNRFDEAKSSFIKALKLDPTLATGYVNLGEIFRDQGLFDAAQENFQKATDYFHDNEYLHYSLGMMFKLQGRTNEAIDSFNNALAIKSDYSQAFWEVNKILPVIYENTEQIELFRKRFRNGLNKISRSLDMKNRYSVSRAMIGASSSTNFFLQYQGLNDTSLQRQYGILIHSIMSAMYPGYSQTRYNSSLIKARKIRVGYASAFLRSHNGALWLLGWLRHRNKQDFEVYCYHTGSKIDDATENFKRLCDHYHHIPDNLELACKQIIADNLDILVYPEIGMHSLTMLMAGLRLAPIQCAGWGHPITSGLPTMDYWLSSDLMEPDNGQEHYTEKLVRLPNLAHCYSKTQHDNIHSNYNLKSRKDFGLDDNSVIYLCSQSLYKYLPQHDYILPGIAKRIPKARFVFLAISSVFVVKRFMERVDLAFKKAGLQASKYCTMLNRLSPEDFISLNRVSDVFLDNPSWSGNNSTLVAMDCYLPAVTYPTEFMRGRHTFAILKMLGLGELIASSGEEYIEIAARLGNDASWRSTISRKIAENNVKLYEDTSCVQALEDFFMQAVTRKAAGVE